MHFVGSTVLRLAATVLKGGWCMQPIMGERADAIAQECPGLFQVEGKGKSRKAKVNSAREHPKLLEKVWLIYGMLPAPFYCSFALLSIAQ